MKRESTDRSTGKWKGRALTVADDVQHILHGQEVESREDLAPPLQEVEEGLAAILQAVVHVLQNLQDVCNNRRHVTNSEDGMQFPKQLAAL